MYDFVFFCNRPRLLLVQIGFLKTPFSSFSHFEIRDQNRFRCMFIPISERFYYYIIGMKLIFLFHKQKYDYTAIAVLTILVTGALIIHHFSETRRIQKVKNLNKLHTFSLIGYPLLTAYQSYIHGVFLKTFDHESYLELVFCDFCFVVSFLCFSVLSLLVSNCSVWVCIRKKLPMRWTSLLY